ncbi:MAG: ribonuclease P protein component [Alphaproteobacteria bacterium]|nr:ribonuclease P protein component [Alphaproteobacteria bacterium]
MTPGSAPSGAPPRLERLKRRADFLKATRARNSAAAPGLVLQARVHDAADRAAADRRAAGRTADDEIIRVGFTASRKVGGAVDRNRAKRRLRALAEEVLRARALPGADYVLIARAATAERAFDKLRRDLISALKRLGRLRASGTMEGAPTARREDEGRGAKDPDATG